MDWDKVIDTVAGVARKTFTLALSLVLIMLAVGGTYAAGAAVWWFIRRVHQALGS